MSNTKYGKCTIKNNNLPRRNSNMKQIWMVEDILTGMRKRTKARSSLKCKEINKEIVMYADKPKKNGWRRNVFPQEK